MYIIQNSLGFGHWVSVLPWRGGMYPTVASSGCRLSSFGHAVAVIGLLSSCLLALCLLDSFGFFSLFALIYLVVA
jgi:hypothetical protein